MARKKNIGWTIREQDLNNKSRKGKYVYIKKANKRASYYKVKDVPLTGNFDYYMALYEGNLGKGRKGVSKRRVKLQKSLTHDDIIQRAKTSKLAIDKIIGKGIWSTQMDSAFSKSPEDIRELYKELLFKAILSRDPKTLDILTQEQNIQKFKNRFEFKINVVNESGETLAYLEHIGKKDLEEVMSDIKRIFPRGYNINKGKSPSEHMRQSQQSNYQIREINSGKVHDFNVRLIMRKGK